jgi:hypothetical protein
VHKEKPRRSGGALKPLSGDHGSAAPALAQTFNVPGTVVSDAAAEQIGPDQFIFGKDFHNTIADLKPDVPEIDHPIIAEIQHLLDIAHDTNAVGAPGDGPTRCDQGPVAATPGRISFCLTGDRCEGDAISDEVRAIMASRWAQAAASKAAALTIMS